MLLRYLPMLSWLNSYDRTAFSQDAIAAVIVTVMLIPQSLAYALLAGLPPQVGLYASILPLIVYALFASSRTLSVGPVAVISLMTAAAVGQLGVNTMEETVKAAIALAFISGLMLIVMGMLRLGMLANFLSHPVISGFITASGILIAASQLRHLLGIDASGHTLLDITSSLLAQWHLIHGPTLLMGASALTLLLLLRWQLKPMLIKLGCPPNAAQLLAKTGPVVAVIATGMITFLAGLEEIGIAVVGHIPAGLPSLSLPMFDQHIWQQLLVSALLISVIGFVESVSVAQTLAAKRRQHIHPDQELIGLGGANLASAVSGGFPVTGGFSRSVVNFDAGAHTPAAGLFTAIGIAIAALWLTPLLYFLPKATLAATIIVAVLSLLDFRAMQRTWHYSRSDFAAMFATIVMTLMYGVEIGISSGVILSIVLFLHRTSRPHNAVVGRVPGTEHFRNVERVAVETDTHILTIRVDESLYFANARYLEELVTKKVAANPAIKHLILMCPAVNWIDASALESLEAINQRLKDSGVSLHLSEIKGPVMDQLQRSDFLTQLTGRVFMSQYEAWCYLRHGPDGCQCRSA